VASVENNFVPSFPPRSPPPSFIPFVVPARALGWLGAEARLQRPWHGKVTDREREEDEEQGGSGDNKGKGVVTFDSGVLYTMLFVRRVRNTWADPLPPPGSFIILPRAVPLPFPENEKMSPPDGAR